MTTDVLELVKARLGISTTVRDTYLTAIIDSIIQELKNIQGLIVVDADKTQLMFIADYAEYRYSNRDNPEMPRHLQFRLHNLLINNKTLTVGSILIVDVLPIFPLLKTVYICAGRMQMYLNSTWDLVNMVEGLWVVV